MTQDQDELERLQLEAQAPMLRAEDPEQPPPAEPVRDCPARTDPDTLEAQRPTGLVNYHPKPEDLPDGDGSREPMGAPLLRPWPTTSGNTGFLYLDPDGDTKAPAGVSWGNRDQDRMELGLVLGPLVWRVARYRRTDELLRMEHPHHPDSYPGGIELPVFRFVGWRSDLATNDPTVQAAYGGGELGAMRERLGLEDRRDA